MDLNKNLLEYIQIVLTVKNEHREKGKGVLYFKHHIFPRSLYPNLKNKEWNIILVTYQEHKRLHELLATFTTGHCQEVMKRDLNYFC